MWCDVPGEQLRDAADRVVGDARQDRAQVRLRIKAVEFGRADQTVDGCGALSTGVGASKQIVLPVMYRST